MIIVGIDPGPVRSGVVIIAGNKIAAHWHARTEEVSEAIEAMGKRVHAVAIERVRPYGSAMAAVTVDTAEWSAVIRYAAERAGLRTLWLSRQDVKRALFGKVIGNDAVIKRHLCALFAIEQSRRMMHNDEWAALAVAVAAKNILQKEERK